MNFSPINNVALNGGIWNFAPYGTSNIELSSQCTIDIWAPSGHGAATIVLDGELKGAIAKGIFANLQSDIEITSTLKAIKLSMATGQALIEFCGGFFAGMYITVAGDIEVTFNSNSSLYKRSMLRGNSSIQIESTGIGNIAHYASFDDVAIAFTPQLEIYRGSYLQGQRCHILFNNRGHGVSAKTHRPRLSEHIGIYTELKPTLEIRGISASANIDMSSLAALRTTERAPLSGKTAIDLSTRADIRFFTAHPLSGSSTIEISAWSVPGKPVIPTEFIAAHKRRQLMVPRDNRAFIVPKERRL